MKPQAHSQTYRGSHGNVAARKRVIVTTLVAIGLASGVGVIGALRPTTSALVPGQAPFRGKSLETWNVMWSEWAIGTELGGAETPNTSQGVRFLPAAFTSGQNNFDVLMSPGTPFVSPSFFVFGESYDDADTPDDNPNDQILDTIFQTTQVEVRLNGTLIMQGAASDLANHKFGPVRFDEPIVYEDPQPRGEDLNSTAALFVLGIGAIYQPLPVGQHVLETKIDSAFFGKFTNTYNITVAK